MPLESSLEKFEKYYKDIYEGGKAKHLKSQDASRRATTPSPYAYPEIKKAELEYAKAAEKAKQAAEKAKQAAELEQKIELERQKAEEKVKQLEAELLSSPRSEKVKQAEEKVKQAAEKVKQAELEQKKIQEMIKEAELEAKKADQAVLDYKKAAAEKAGQNIPSETLAPPSASIQAPQASSLQPRGTPPASLPASQASSLQPFKPSLLAPFERKVHPKTGEEINPEVIAKTIGLKAAHDVANVPYTPNPYEKIAEPTPLMEMATNALERLSKAELQAPSEETPKFGTARSQKMTEEFLSPEAISKKAQTFKDHLLRRIEQSSRRRLEESVSALGRHLSAAGAGRVGYEDFMKRKLEEKRLEDLMDLEAKLGVSEEREQENLAERRARTAQQFDESQNVNLLRSHQIERAEKELKRKHQMENIENLFNMGSRQQQHKQQDLEKKAQQFEASRAYQPKKLEEYGRNISMFSHPLPPMYHPERTLVPASELTHKFMPRETSSTTIPYQPIIPPTPPLGVMPDRPVAPTPFPPSPEPTPFKDLVGTGMAIAGTIGSYNEAKAREEYYKKLAGKIS